MVDLANAVNDVSAAYRHAGAADAVDDVIRTIERRGTSGLLMNWVGRRAGEAATGRQGLQCRAIAAIERDDPYSMDFTDAYRTLERARSHGGRNGALRTSGDCGRAQRHRHEQETCRGRRQRGRRHERVLADASEHTGQASAFHQIAVRFADAGNR